MLRSWSTNIGRVKSQYTGPGCRKNGQDGLHSLAFKFWWWLFCQLMGVYLWMNVWSIAVTEGYFYSELQVLLKTLNWAKCNFRQIFSRIYRHLRGENQDRSLGIPGCSLSHRGNFLSSASKLNWGSGQILTFHNGKCTPWRQTCAGLFLDCLGVGWLKRIV